MAAGIRISGMGKLRKAFADKRQKKTEVSSSVGFTANYALPVHEATHTSFKAPGTRSKFLESTTRELSDDLVSQIGRDVKKGLQMEDAIQRAALRLQAAALKITPIDTGNLRRSSFARKDQ